MQLLVKEVNYIMTSRTSLWRKRRRDIEQILETDCQDIVHNETQNEEGYKSFHEETLCSMNGSQDENNLSDNSLNDDSDIEVNISDNEIEIQPSTQHLLASWATRNCISRAALNELLAILSSHNLSLPKDARTLLKTPTSVATVSKCGGEFVYLGIYNGIIRTLENNVNITCVELMVNVDGLPLFKSSGTQLWPILGKFHTFKPFIIALFCGKGKPDSVDLFLEEFLNEYEDLSHNGFIFQDKHYQVVLKLFCCDAPARQFLKCIKGHTGYYSCERCLVRGSYENCVVFCEEECELRSDGVFERFGYQDHQFRLSPLTNFNVKCIQQFVLDFMHLVCLGVVKRLLLRWTGDGRSRKGRLSSRHIDEISLKLSGLNFPSEFTRQPRGLNEVRRWKATEFYQFLIYSGPVVLKGILDRGTYIHFLALSIAMRICCNEDLEVRTRENVLYSKELLIWFVKKAKDIYGISFISYNVHNLIHICDDVLYYEKNLMEISAFDFENHMQVLKKYVRKAQNPLVQVVKRSAELENCAASYSVKNICTTISTNEKNAWFLLKSGSYAKVILSQNGQYQCKIYKNQHLHNLFTEPTESKNLGIVILINNTKTEKLISKDDIKKKVVCVNTENGYVLVPLLSQPKWK